MLKTMGLKFFGTDGIRGAYGSAALNDNLAYRAGVAAVRVAREAFSAETPIVLVGRDTRASGVSLVEAIARGVSKEGGQVIDLGIAPTPCVAFAAKKSPAHFAISVTASHNPAADNGIKFFTGEGVKLSEWLEQSLDDAIGAVAESVADEGSVCQIVSSPELVADYVQAIEASFEAGFLSGKRIAIDCANGAMSQIAPALFRSLGAELTVVADTPDGSNINAGVGSEHPEALLAMLTKDRYHFAFAFDGDGDRVIAFDENGKKVPGEALLALLATDAKSRGSLEGDVLVTTVQSNLGLEAALKPQGVSVIRTDVGDKHIVRSMLANGYSVGGEESGHVVLGRFAVTGDGLFAALALAELVVNGSECLSERAAIYRAFPQESVAIRVEEKVPLERCERIQACIEKVESDLGEDGRLLVRYSGTEPKIRLLVEAVDAERVAEAMGSLKEAVAADLKIV